MKKIIMFAIAVLFAGGIKAQNVGDPCVMMNSKGSITVGSYENVTVNSSKSNADNRSNGYTNTNSNSYNSNAGMKVETGVIGGSFGMGMSETKSRSNTKSSSKTSTRQVTESYQDKRCVDTDRYKSTILR